MPSAGKAVAAGFVIGLKHHALHDIGMDAQIPDDGLCATWQANGRIQFVRHGIRLGSTQAPGHMQSTSLAVWHAPDRNPTVSTGISTYVLQASMLYDARCHCLFAWTRAYHPDRGGAMLEHCNFYQPQAVMDVSFVLQIPTHAH